MENQWKTITDDVGRELMGRSGDLAARWLLLDLQGALIDEDRSAWCLMVHAEQYLSDRIGYEMEPWPEGMFEMPA